MASVSSTASTAGTSLEKGTQTSSQKLGKDDFLKLLITQLRFQDPMSPMEDKEFITQMAQFNSLEEMQKLNTNLAAQGEFAQLTQASGLIGKAVQAQVSDDKTVVGTVVEVRKIDSVLKVMVQPPPRADGTYDPPVAVAPDKIDHVTNAA